MLAGWRTPIREALLRTPGQDDHDFPYLSEAERHGFIRSEIARHANQRERFGVPQARQSSADACRAQLGLVCHAELRSSPCDTAYQSSSIRAFETRPVAFRSSCGRWECSVHFNR